MVAIIIISIYTLSDLGVLSNLIGSLSLANQQLLDEAEQNIVICRWRADQLFAEAEGRGK